jgi:hypothetical protein
VRLHFDNEGVEYLADFVQGGVLTEFLPHSVLLGSGGNSQVRVHCSAEILFPGFHD